MASSKKIRGLLVEIGGDTTKLQTSLKEVDKNISNLSKELKGINTLLKFDPNNKTILNQKSEVLAESIEETTKKLKSLKEAQEQLDNNGINKNTNQYRDLQREIESTQIKLSDLKNEASNWNQAGKALEIYGNKIETLGNKINNVGTKVTTGLTLPIVALGTYTAKAAIDFETAFAGVEKTVDGTSKQLESLKQGIMSMAEELPASTTEIAAVAEAAGQLGIATDDILKFTRVMIDLGESTNLSANDAASALAKFANITGMSANDYSKLGSVIVDLGNNFATTEADIVSMATRLAATGELTGLTEAQILALATAMSSVGIEAEAGGSAMSKLLKKIQLSVELNSESLKQYASVAGMTAKQFKKSFQEDAIGALSAFISGLNDTKRNGKSAIAILDEMELTEVRLSNTILSLANSSGVLTSAVNTANNAWDENSALTKEAEKRYATTESQMDITKNKLNNIAITLGNNLLPHINDFLDKISKLTNKFSNLSKEEQKSILKKLALIAAIGPLIKILGSTITITGKVTKGIGTFTSALSLAKNGIGTATGSAAILAKVLTGLSSPIGVATIAIGLFTAAQIKMANDSKKAIEATKAQMDQLKELSDAYKEKINVIEDAAQADLNNIDYTQRLHNELSKIVDAEGKVKEGYELRANFIINELSRALGIEIKLTDGIIQNYKNLQKEISNTILKKKAEILFNAEEEKWATAIDNASDSYKRLADAQEEALKLQKKLKDEEATYQERLSGAGLREQREIRSKMESLREQTKIAKDTVKELEATYNSQLDILRDYELSAEIFYSDDIDAIKRWVTEKSLQYTTDEGNLESTLKNNINQLSYTIDYYKKKYLEDLKNKDEISAKANLIQAQANEESLKLVVERMKKETSAIEKNSPEIIAAWKDLAINSREKYNEVLLTLPSDTRAVITSMTGVAFDEAEGFASSLANLALYSKEEFNAKIKDLPDNMKKIILDMVNKINANSGQVTDATKSMMTNVLKEIDKSDEGKKAGINLLEGINRGINDKQTTNKVKTSFLNLGNSLLTTLKNSWDIHSPSKKSEKLAKYLLQGIETGIMEETPNVLKQAKKASEEILEAFSMTSNFNSLNDIQRGLNQKVTESTRNIFTTPNIVFNVKEELTRKQLNDAFDYVNDRFGSEY